MLKVPARSLLLALAATCCLLAQQPAPKTTVSPSVHLPQSSVDADTLVKDLRFSDLATAVTAMQPSLEHDYFAGVLANREGHVAESISVLEKVVPRIRSSNPARAAVALHTLADDYAKSFAYDKAIAVYQDLLHHFASQLDNAERQSTNDDYGVFLLLQGTPAQTISLDGAVDLPIHRNAVRLTVNGITAPWILDTGANLSTVSETFARRLGLQLSKGKAQTQGVTGAENTLRIAVLPELKLGGATVRNVVLLVLQDSALHAPWYQINAVLGYPVLQALGKITFTSDGHLLAGPGSPGISDGARLFMDQLTPLLECRVEDRAVLFSFDTGANHTAFSARYQETFPAQFRRLKKRRHRLSGVGGKRRLDAFYVRNAELGVGTTSVILHNVPVLPPLGTDGDKLFGNLGRDLTAPYRSFTIDFSNMRFALGPKRE